MRLNRRLLVPTSFCTTVPTLTAAAQASWNRCAERFSGRQAGSAEIGSLGQYRVGINSQRQKGKSTRKTPFPSRRTGFVTCKEKLFAEALWWWNTEPNPRPPRSSPESVRKPTVLVLDHSADLGCIRQIGMTANLAQFDAATGSQPTTQLAEQGVARIDKSYTPGYSSCIYCVCAQRRKPCATPPSIYGHCPRSET